MTVRMKCLLVGLLLSTVIYSMELPVPPELAKIPAEKRLTWLLDHAPIDLKYFEYLKLRYFIVPDSEHKPLVAIKEIKGRIDALKPGQGKEWFVFNAILAWGGRCIKTPGFDPGEVYYKRIFWYPEILATFPDLNARIARDYCIVSMAPFRTRNRKAPISFLENTSRAILPYYIDRSPLTNNDANLSRLYPSGISHKYLMEASSHWSLDSRKKTNIAFLCRFALLLSQCADKETSPPLKESLREQALLYIWYATMRNDFGDENLISQEKQLSICEAITSIYKKQGKSARTPMMLLRITRRCQTGNAPLIVFYAKQGNDDKLERVLSASIKEGIRSDVVFVANALIAKKRAEEAVVYLTEFIDVDTSDQWRLRAALWLCNHHRKVTKDRNALLRAIATVEKGKYARNPVCLQYLQKLSRYKESVAKVGLGQMK